MNKTWRIDINTCPSCHKSWTTEKCDGLFEAHCRECNLSMEDDGPYQKIIKILSNEKSIEWHLCPFNKIDKDSCPHPPCMIITRTKCDVILDFGIKE